MPSSTEPVPRVSPLTPPSRESLSPSPTACLLNPTQAPATASSGCVAARTSSDPYTCTRLHVPVMPCLVQECAVSHTLPNRSKSTCDCHEDPSFVTCKQTTATMTVVSPSLNAPRNGSASASAEPDYLQGMSARMCASTDMLIVVQGTALPCHKQVMAVHSKVFNGMADLVPSHGHGACVCNAASSLPPDGQLMPKQSESIRLGPN